MNATLADALTLDIRTLAVVAVVVLAVAGLVPIVLRRLAPDEDAVRTWTGAAALGITASVLSVQRAHIWDALGLVAADALASTAFVLVVQGTRQIIGNKARRRVAFAHGVAFALIDIPLVYLWPNPTWRLTLMITVIGCWSAIAAQALWRSGLASGRFLASVFGLLGGLAAFRVIGLLIRGDATSLFAPTPEHLIDFGGAIIVGLMGTIGALLLVAEVVLEQLRAEAYRDALTGLANRAALEDSAARELARARRLDHPLGLMIIDIDRFKSVNDRFGHAAGDAVLQAVAGTMRTTLRREDELGRFGGEEFVALLPGAGELELALIGERLRRAVADTIVVAAGHKIAVSVSVGGTCFRRDEIAWADALERADKNLYAAKREGRDRVIVGSGEGLPVSPKQRSPVSAPPRRISGASPSRRPSGEFPGPRRRASGELPRG